MVARLKVLARLDTTRREIPQDGAFKVPREGIEPASARLAIMPTIHGEKAVIRFLGVEDPSDLTRLNLSAAVLEELRVFMQRREGMALFAGPTGSGKSTTIYGVLQELAKGGRSVVSIEDPVERDIREISQTSIDEKLGLDFPTALRAILRQDPDVIALGEIRDAESARTAFHAALTGHLVVGTVHARRALDVPIRVGHLGVDPLTIAEALRLIVCQRLVPLLCRGCRVLDLVASNRAGVSLYREVGCDRCDYSGFSERRVVAEYIALDRKAAAVLAAHGRFAPEDLPKRSTSLEGELRALLLSGLISSRQFGAYVSD
jgi:type II secretory ATPase GspE/PulE/Tfp pilus assembly ATPase PilB-like protein